MDAPETTALASPLEPATGSAGTGPVIPDNYTFALGSPVLTDPSSATGLAPSTSEFGITGAAETAKLDDMLAAAAGSTAPMEPPEESEAGTASGPLEQRPDGRVPGLGQGVLVAPTNLTGILPAGRPGTDTSSQTVMAPAPAPARADGAGGLRFGVTDRATSDALDRLLPADGVPSTARSSEDDRQVDDRCPRRASRVRGPAARPGAGARAVERGGGSRIGGRRAGLRVHQPGHDPRTRRAALPRDEPTGWVGAPTVRVHRSGHDRRTGPAPRR